MDLNLVESLARERQRRISEASRRIQTSQTTEKGGMAFLRKLLRGFGIHFSKGVCAAEK